MPDPVSVSQEIVAPADQVWAMVADVTRMGEWSPETEAATWLRGAQGPEPGSKFRGTNRNGKRKWNTTASVVEAEPGHRFSFRVNAGPFKVAEWRYDFESTPTGCRVTESWIDQRGRVARALGKPVSGVEDRATHNRAGMEQTLQRLKTVAESSQPAH